ncbi:hypothetical protein KFE25_004951 [Diacronema lutheri]|uniref:Glycosyl transferase CAP10 domain-containing protein n=2 Tax=Diacronema lutheri TaxID=2081491 RepID=A0A8J5XHW6_DIALT|nr:hypothetical protein KFE25_004951 [Diacronema lutheri]
MALMLFQPRVQLVPAWTPAPLAALPTIEAAPAGARAEPSCASYAWDNVIGADLAHAAAGARGNTSTRAILHAVNAQRARGAPLILLSARAGRIHVHHATAPWCGRWGRCWFRARALLDGLQLALAPAGGDEGSAPDVDLVLCLADDCDDAAAALPVPPIAFSRTLAPAARVRVDGGPAAAAPPVGGARTVRVPYDYVRVAAAGCAALGAREAARALLGAPLRALTAPRAAAAEAAPVVHPRDGAAPWCGVAHALPWEARAHVAVFRGGWANEQRERLCALAAAAPAALDVALTAVRDARASSCRVAPFESLEEQAGRARMLIDVAGVTWSDRLPRALASGATLLVVARPHGSTDYLQPYLRPWVHYIPVAADLSDLSRRMRWCGEHEAECAAIAARGAALANTYASAAGSRCFLRQLVRAYAERVQRARVVDDCGPAPARACGMHPLQPAPPRSVAGEAALVLSFVVDAAAGRWPPIGVRVWRRRVSGRRLAWATVCSALVALALCTCTLGSWASALHRHLRAAAPRIAPGATRLGAKRAPPALSI